MEMTPSSQSTALLDPQHSRFAGLSSIVLGLAGVGLLLASMLNHWGQDVSLTLLQMTGIVLFALTSVAGVNLMRGCLWSQRLLLAFWLVMLLLSLVLVAQYAAWREPTWWKAFSTWNPLAAALPTLAISIIQCVLLVLATAANTRTRFGALVVVAIGATAAFTVVLNLMAQKYPLQKDLETLGQYGLTDRTKKIIEKIDEPVQITIIYTATDKDRRGADFRDSVVEVAQQMQREAQRTGKRTFNLVNVTSDFDRARILDRLQKQQTGAAPAHMAFLNKFTATSEKLLKDIEAEQAKWQTVPADSFIGYWGVPAYLSDRMDAASQEVKRVQGDVQQQLSRGVPDMAKLVESVTKVLQDTKDDLTQATDVLEKLAKMPEAVQKNAPEAKKAAQEAEKAVGELVQVLGAAGTTAPSDPAPVLKEIAKTTAAAGNALNALAKQLNDLAGETNASLLASSGVWRTTLTDPRTRTPRPTTLGQVVITYRDLFGRLSEGAQTAMENLKPEAQAENIAAFREQVPLLTKALSAKVKEIREAIDRLSVADPLSAGIFKETGEKKLLADLLTPVNDLIQDAGKLPEIKASTLSQDIAGDNIVLVELGNKTEVVPFDSVWPLKSRGPFQMSAAEGAPKRVFNGDSALGSKLLTMSAHGPFATVYLCYVAPPLSPQMAQMKLNPDLRPWNLILARLKESNFEIKEWNLNEPMPEADRDIFPPSTQASQKADKPPKVLLLLPMPPSKYLMMANPYGPPQTSFTPEHVGKIQRELNAGTPAMVLTQFGAEGAEELLKYLQSDWGTKVLADHMFFAATPDESEPGKFRIDIKRIVYMPLNNFAAEPPVGMPLRTQRVLWRALCPIEKAPVEKKDGKPVRTVEYQPLLSVPKAKDRWAIAEANIGPMVNRLLEAGGSDFVAPDYAHGDLPGPFDVAAALSCPKSDTVGGNRVIVSSMGASLMDDQMQRRIEEKDGRFADPPKANAEFVPNAVYWLIGREGYIGSGPAQIKPVDITPGQLAVVQPVVVAALPLLVLGLGGLILMMRRAR